MRKSKCQNCGQEKPLGEMFRVEGRTLCEPCADKAVASAGFADRQIGVSHEIDPTICAKCQTDYGSADLPLVGGAPFCGQCSQGLYDRPFPQWLKLGLAGALLLLVAALWHGRAYFRAGRQLVLAERAMDRHDYAEAQKRFAEVMKINPTEQRVLLLAAKADLLTGDIDSAQAALKRRPTYERNELFTEVDQTFDRAEAAWKKAEEASRLVDENKDDEAEKLMSEAAALYPESKDLARGAESYADNAASSAAWNRKDYDAFLAVASAAMQRHPTEPSVVAAVASALACKFAVTGDPEFRRRAENLLTEARTLSQKSPEAQASYTEYAERIRHRLDTREIIDKAEYERRFRGQKGRS